MTSKRARGLIKGRVYNYRRHRSDTKDRIKGKNQLKKENKASRIKKSNEQFFGPVEEECHPESAETLRIRREAERRMKKLRLDPEPISNADYEDPDYDSDEYEDHEYGSDEDDTIWFGASSEHSFDEDLTWNQQFWSDQPFHEEEGFEEEYSYAFDVEHKIDESDGSLSIHTGKLSLSGLDPTVTEENLLAAFCHYGDILSVSIAKDEENRSLGYGDITFFSAADAAICKAMLDNTDLHGSVVRIGFTHEDCISTNSSSRSSVASPSKHEVESAAQTLPETVVTKEVLKEPNGMSMSYEVESDAPPVEIKEQLEEPNEESVVKEEAKPTETVIEEAKEETPDVGRYDIVTGAVEVDGAKEEDAMDQIDDTEKGVPEFWLTAMKHNQITGKEKGGNTVAVVKPRDLPSASSSSSL